MKTLLSLFALLTLCVSCGTLAPGGAYNGDKVLYDADWAIATSYDVTHTFVQWEYANRDLLADHPEIHRAANSIREKAPAAFRSALAVRDAYRADPTATNRDNLQTAIAVVRALALEATRWLADAGSLTLGTN